MTHPPLCLFLLLVHNSGNEFLQLRRSVGQIILCLVAASVEDGGEFFRRYPTLSAKDIGRYGSRLVDVKRSLDKQGVSPGKPGANHFLEGGFDDCRDECRGLPVQLLIDCPFEQGLDGLGAGKTFPAGNPVNLLAYGSCHPARGGKGSPLGAVFFWTIRIYARRVRSRPLIRAIRLTRGCAFALGRVIILPYIPYGSSLKFGSFFSFWALL